MKNNKGFTLIELVIVIVILGILAAVAVPKFADMTTEAEIAAADGVFGAANSATAINHAKYLVSSDITATPAYHATNCAGGLIINAACLEETFDGGLPNDWAADAGNICFDTDGDSDCDDETKYVIAITAETTTAKAQLTKGW